MPEIIRREGCVFCKIVAKEEPATIRYEDDEVIVFDNKLTWAPIMLPGCAQKATPFRKICGAASLSARWAKWPAT